MNRTPRPAVRTLLGVGVAAAMLGSLSGCQQSRRIAARVGGDPIYMEELADQALKITPQQLDQQRLGLDVGGYTLLALLRDKLTDQLARERKAAPSDDTIARVVSYVERSDPQATAALQSGQADESDLTHQIRITWEEFALGTNGDKADESAVRAAYETAKLTVPPTYAFRILPVQNPKLDPKVMEALKQGDFQKAAELLGVPAVAAASAGQLTTMRSDDSRLPPALKTALDKLSPGQITPNPVPITNGPASSPAMPATYVMIQLVSKTPEHRFTLEEVRPLMERTVLMKTHPDWQQHYAYLFSEYARSADIQVDIKRYATIKDALIQPTTLMPPGASAPPPSGPSPSGPSSGGSAPGARQPGGSTSHDSTPSGGATHARPTAP